MQRDCSSKHRSQYSIMSLFFDCWTVEFLCPSSALKCGWQRCWSVKSTSCSCSSRNVKLNALNRAHQLLPAIVFGARCFSTLLSFSPLKAGEWSAWAGDGPRFGNLRSVRAQFVTSGAKHWDWWDVETQTQQNERWDVCSHFLHHYLKSRLKYVPEFGANTL